MAYTNVMMLQGAQAGGETTRGTGVTPTRWLYPTMGGVSVTYNQDADDYTESTRSYHGKKTHALGRYSVDLTAEERVSFEDLPWWLNYVLLGGETTPSTVDTTGKEYVFTPTSNADDLKFMTIRAGDPGNVYLFEGVAVNEMQIRINPESEATWMMSASMMGNKMTAGSSFAAISERARTMVPAKGTKIYMDDTSSIGTTQLQGVVRSATVTVQNNWERKAFLEDAATFSADMARGEQLVTAEVVFEFKDDTQFAKMRSGTVRKVRIVSEGAQIGAGPAKYKAQIDLPNAYYQAPSIGFSGQNRIITFGLVGYTSSTTAYPIEATVVNAEASITL